MEIIKTATTLTKSTWKWTSTAFSINNIE